MVEVSTALYRTQLPRHHSIYASARHSTSVTLKSELNEVYQSRASMKLLLASGIIATTVVAGEIVENATLLSPPNNATHAKSPIGLTSNLVNTCTFALNVDWGGQSSEVRGDRNYCCRRCIDEPHCIAYTWTDYQGGTCWLKSSAYRNSLVSKLGAESCILSGPYEPSMAQFATNCDLPGNDYFSYNLKSNDVNICNGLCLFDKQCKAVTWTDYQGGTCWFKNGVPACVYKQGAISNVKFDQP